MRNSFFKIIKNIAIKDKNVYLLTANLGFKLFDEFRQHINEQFIDVGVAEANMIGIASGLAISGKNIYCYSIIPFLIMRAYEQIRIDIAYHNLNVKLVGVGGGFTYGFEGFTHFALEDFSLMRTLPNMTIVAPADRFEAECIAKISYKHPGPMYIRLTRSGEPEVHKTTPDFKIGKPIFISEGKDIAIFAIGSMVHVGKQVRELLLKKGINITLIDMHTLKPFNAKIVNQILSRHKIVFSLEEHYLIGGLGTSIAETIAENSHKVIFKSIGISCLKKCIGNADYLRMRYGLSANSIYKRILEVLK